MSGFVEWWHHFRNQNGVPPSPTDIARVAFYAGQKFEREACAEVADNVSAGLDCYEAAAAGSVADSIRDRDDA